MSTPIGRMLNEPGSPEYRGVHETDPVSALLYALATGADTDNIPDPSGLLQALKEIINRPSTSQLPESQSEQVQHGQDIRVPEALRPTEPWMPPMTQVTVPYKAPGQMQQAPQPNPTHLTGMHPPWYQPPPAGLTGPPTAAQAHPYMNRGLGRFAQEEQQAKQLALGPDFRPATNARLGPGMSTSQFGAPIFRPQSEGPNASDAAFVRHNVPGAAFSGNGPPLNQDAASQYALAMSNRRAYGRDSDALAAMLAGMPGGGLPGW